MSLFEMIDLKTKPDIIHNYEDFRGSAIPLVIDNGKFLSIASYVPVFSRFGDKFQARTGVALAGPPMKRRC